MTLIGLDEVVEAELVEIEKIKTDKEEEEKEVSKVSMNIPAIRTQAATPTMQESSEDEEEEREEETVNQKNGDQQEEENRSTEAYEKGNVTEPESEVQKDEQEGEKDSQEDLVVLMNSDETEEQEFLEDTSQEDMEFTADPEKTRDECETESKEEIAFEEQIDRSALQLEVGGLLAQLFKQAAGNCKDINLDPSALQLNGKTAELDIIGNLEIVAAEEEAEYQEEIAKDEDFGNKWADEASVAVLSADEGTGIEQIEQVSKQRLAKMEHQMDTKELPPMIEKVQEPVVSDLVKILSSAESHKEVSVVTVEPNRDVAVDSASSNQEANDTEKEEDGNNEKDSQTEHQEDMVKIKEDEATDEAEKPEADQTASADYDDDFEEFPGPLVAIKDPEVDITNGDGSEEQSALVATKILKLTSPMEMCLRNKLPWLQQMILKLTSPMEMCLRNKVPWLLSQIIFSRR